MIEPEKRKIDYFKNIIAVAYADGNLDPFEKEFLIEKAQDLDIPIENVDDLIKEVEQIAKVIPVEGFPKEEQLADAITTALLDGEIDDKEIKICMEIGIALGFEEQYIHNLIENSIQLWKQLNS
ncbi:hypothetical protein ACFLU5_04055 [Bacteroidota bacterium]